MCEEQQQPSDQCLIQRFRSHRDFTHREFGILIVDMHMYSGTPDSPIPDMLLSRALAPSSYTMVHVTVYHVTVTIPLVGVSGFRTS
jgi:hypothetical protein